MAPMNDLINENMPRLKAFIDALGEVCAPCRLGRVLGCVMGVCTCWEYG